MEPRVDAAHARATLHRLWTQQLAREYENIVFQHKAPLRPATVRVEPLKGRWGLWDPALRLITLSDALIQQHSWDVVIEVLKHEMAHQLVTEYFYKQEAHGSCFSTACSMLGVAPWAARASGELPREIESWKHRAVPAEEERLLKKVEKLLSLATSSNEHEALSAMQRVREIYARHNLRHAESGVQGTMVYLHLGRKRKRIDQVESMIYCILVDHFFVRAIYGRLFDAQDGCDYRTVEILGRRENVVMAEYVFHFLHDQLPHLWKNYRAREGKAATAKHSYMLGVLSGFTEKLRRSEPLVESESESESDSGRSRRQTAALVRVAEAEVESFVKERHPRLTTRTWGGGYRDPASFSAGRADGAQITLHKPLTEQRAARGLLLR